MKTTSTRYASPPLSVRLLCALAAGLLFACSQDEGDPCQADRDCDDGLICRIAAGSERGTCADPNADVIDMDGGMAPDAREPELPDDDAGLEPPADEDAGESASDDAGS